MNLRVTDEFRNVFIFVADALRYDYAPDHLTERWSPIKTIASGVASPTSFSTMVTGRYPPQHGVFGFNHKLPPDIPTMFQLTPNPSFYRGGGEVGKVLGTQAIPDQPIEEASPPFISLERDLVTHAPYGEIFTWDNAKFDSHEAYWRTRKGDTSNIVADYEKAAELEAERFQSRLTLLEQRGLRDDTLVIFTADHGELLGEDGLVGHGNITRPELVYVPTMFCNDGIEVQEDQTMAHVDLVPTIASILDLSMSGLSESPGYDLTNGVPDHRIVFNQMRRWWSNEWSAWDGAGGYVFSDDTFIDRIKWVGTRLLTAQESVYSRRHLSDILRAAYRRWRVNPIRFGQPHFDEQEADEFCRDIMTDTRRSTHRPIDEESKERLRAMGYIDDIR